MEGNVLSVYRELPQASKARIMQLKLDTKNMETQGGIQTQERGDGPQNFSIHSTVLVSVNLSLCLTPLKVYPHMRPCTHTYTVLFIKQLIN